MTPETKLKIKVNNYLKTIKNCWFTKISDRFSHGIPDFLICYQGKFIAIELKATHNASQSQAFQSYNINEIIKAKGIGAICYSVEDVKRLIIQAHEVKIPA